MCADTLTMSDMAQLLTREIGQERIHAYIVERLKAGVELPTRPVLIRAFAKLSGRSSIEFLLATALSIDETSQARSAAVEALAEYAVQNKDADDQKRVIDALMKLLSDPAMEIRSVASVALSRLEATKAVPMLRDLVDSDKLDPIAEEATRRFVEKNTAENAGQFIPDVAHLFVGREKDLKRLTSYLSSAHGTVVLTGLPGTGKTTLAARLARESQCKYKLWLDGARQPSIADLALEILRQLSLQTASRAELSILDPGKTRLASDAVRAVTEVARRLRNESVLLVIDNYDVSSQTQQLTRFIKALSDALPALQCLVTSRSVPKELAANRFCLDPMDGAESREFIRKTLHSYRLEYHPPDEEAILRLSQGNPYLIRLAVEYLSRGEELPIDAGRPFSPRLVEDLLGLSVDRLPASERRLLEILSLFDQDTIDLRDPVIAAILDAESINELQERSEALCNTGLMQTSADGRIRFAHLAIREYICGQVDLRTVARVNRRLADDYRVRGDVLQAARHLALADDGMAAVELLTDNLARVISAGQADEALGILRKAESAVDPSHPRAAIQRLQIISELSSLRGHYDEAMTAVQRAAASAEQLGDELTETRLRAALATIHYRKGDWTQATEIYKYCLHDFRRLEDWQGVAQTTGNLGNLHLRAGEREHAQALHQEDLRLSERYGDIYGRAQAFNNLGNARFVSEHLIQAKDLYQRSLDLKELTQDIMGTAHTLNNAGLVLVALGELEHALQHYEQSLEISERIGYIHGSAQTLNNLGLAYAAQDLGDLATRSYERCLDLAAQINDELGTAQTICNLGLLHAKAGETEQAIQKYEESLRMLEPLGELSSASRVLGNLSLIFAASHDWERACQSLVKAATANSQADEDSFLARVVWSTSEALYAAHRSDLLSVLVKGLGEAGSAKLADYVSLNSGWPEPYRKGSEGHVSFPPAMGFLAIAVDARQTRIGKGDPETPAVSRSANVAGAMVEQVKAPSNQASSTLASLVKPRPELELNEPGKTDD